MSQAHTQITLVMSQGSNLFLNGEYCFADGTFKRCPDFVTMAAHSYIGHESSQSSF